MSNYAMGHSFTAKDLFINFPIRKLKMTPEICKEIYSDGSKKDLAAHIFTDSVKLVMDDIIENNIQFKLPKVGRAESNIQMNKIEGDDFKKQFRRGKWRDIDFITSNFTGYQLQYTIEGKKRPVRYKPIYIAKQDKDRITEYTNQGKQY